MPPGGVQYQQTSMATMTPGTPVTIPLSYTRPQFIYSVTYDPRQPFVAPVGVDQRVVSRMLQASLIFRQFDKNYSGTLSFKEWKKAMKHLGYYMNKADKHRYISNQINAFLSLCPHTNNQNFIKKRNCFSKELCR
jgi:hypothetical protein